MSSHRRGRPGHAQDFEWTPDDHWDAEQGWPKSAGRAAQAGRPVGNDYRRARILAGAVAAIVVVIAFGAYGVARGLAQLHSGSSVSALQESAIVTCSRTATTPATPAGQARCRSSSPPRQATTSPAQPVTSAPASTPAQPASATPSPVASTPAATPPPTATPQSSAAASRSASTQGNPSYLGFAEVLALINKARAQAGLPAYTVTSGLEASARKHTLLMADGCGLSHQCPGELALGARLTAAGVHWTTAGENIGEGGPDAETAAAIAKTVAGVTQDMLNEKAPDDGHRLNILSSSFTHIGIYVIWAPDGLVWMTQDFSN
jgi:uncharacterized protein YkwD